MCSWVIEDGWYGGTYIDNFLEESKDVCAKICCENLECGTWTWISTVNRCILKKADDLHLRLAGGHFTSKRNQG